MTAMSYTTDGSVATHTVEMSRDNTTGSSTFKSLQARGVRPEN